MVTRWAWTGSIVASLAVLAAVAVYFVMEYQTLEERRHIVGSLRALQEESGPCKALLRATAAAETAASGWMVDVQRLRKAFAGSVVGGKDRRGARALLGATADGLISEPLCEQIKTFADSGETHPVLSLLRFSRDDVPCESGTGTVPAFKASTSYRALMVRELFRDLSRLGCVAPADARRVTREAFVLLRRDALALDDLDVDGIAAYLTTWSPLQTMQFGCRQWARGTAGRLGKVVGCTRTQRQRLLPRYRYAHPFVAGSVSLSAGAEVVLLWENGARCEVLALVDAARPAVVACQDLSPIAELELAVLIERVEYGVVRADLIAGLAHYREGKSGGLSPASGTRGADTWFAYDRHGMLLGVPSGVDFAALARDAGEPVPDAPLRSFCRDVGARYCYDVDWTRLVERVPGNPIVYLSRPLDVLLPKAAWPKEVCLGVFQTAARRQPARGAAVYIYSLLSREGQLIAEVLPDDVNVFWRFQSTELWRHQAFGRSEVGEVPSVARLLGVMDLGRDGKPELIMQRIEREESSDSIQDRSDEIRLLYLEDGGRRFATLTELTIHEY